jgi:alpha-mannosidase
MPSLLAHPDYTRERVRQVARRAAALVHADTRAPDRLRIAGPVDRIAASDAAALDYRDAEPGMALGPLWATWWLAMDGSVPAEWEGEQVDLLLVTNSEATLWLDGEPVQGLVSGGSYVRPEAMLVSRAVAGEALRARVEIACNGLFGWSELHPQPQQSGGSAPPFRLERCELARFDRDAWALSRDLEVLAALMDEPGADDAWRGELLRELNRFCNAWDATSAQRGRRRARSSPRCSSGATRRDARDHRHRPRAHRHGVAVAAGGDVSQVRADVRDPGAAHGALPGVSVRLLAGPAVRVDPRSCAGLWARIRERVAAGQWLPVGGTWIEPDCNLPAGESLVRQFVYGQRFFEHEFGAARACSGTPTCSATTASCRRSCAGAGIDGFLTQKLSWNRFNPPEHHVFRWVGIDGSAVLATSRRPTPTTPRRPCPSCAARPRLQGSRAVGAQPARLRVGRRRRRTDGADARDARARRGPAGRPAHDDRRPEAFFAALADEAQWPEVVGELYLEYHRGTYTTQARTKRASRRAERVAARRRAARAVSDAPWPREELDRRGRRSCSTTSTTSSGLVDRRGPPARRARPRRGRGRPRVACAIASRSERWSTRSAWPVREVVSVGGGLRFAEAPSCGVGQLVAARSEVRVCEDGRRLHARERAPARGPRPRRHPALARRARERARGDGRPRQRPRALRGPPDAFEAWDLDPFHLETRSDCPAASCAEVVIADPLRAEVAFERPIGRASRMHQTVRLDAESSRLEFHCAIDWHEDRRALKVRFPVAVHAPAATYEMQFGVVERPTHYSTRRDLAQYEVPGHRFADLSEHGFGVALLSAATYGWSVYGEQMRMTLLRSPRWPTPRPTSATTPVLRDLPAPRQLAGGRRHRRGAALQRAALLGERRGEARSWFSTDTPASSSTPSSAPRTATTSIVRLYEAHGGRGVGPPARRPPVRRGVVHQPPGGPVGPGRGRRRSRSSSRSAVRDHHRPARDALGEALPSCAGASERCLRAHRPWKPEVLEEGGVGEPGHRRGGVPLERQHEQAGGLAIPVCASGV